MAINQQKPLLSRMKGIPKSLTNGPKITTNQEHIEYGVRNNSHRCPMSLAIRQRFPSARYISIDLQTIRYSLPEYGLRFIWMTPPAGQRFLRYFEGGREGELRPFTMALRGLFLMDIQRRPERKGKKPVRKPKAKLHQFGGGNNLPATIGGKAPSKVGTDRIFGVRAWKEYPEKD